MKLRCLAALASVLVSSPVTPGDEGVSRFFESSVPERLATGFRFTEGPVWSPRGYLLFSDIPANRIYRWSSDGKCTVFREPSGQSNGLAFDRQGRLLACEHANRRVSRTDRSGAVVPFVERYQGKRLNSPNDLAIGPGGAIYFTDPPYGISEGQRELAHNGVYRLAPDGSLTLLADDFDRPNGIAFSPDLKTLYVADTNRAHVRAFDVRRDGGIHNGRVLCELRGEPRPTPDGMKVDVKGNLYVTAGASGLWVVSREGQVLANLMTPEGVANCTFGGADNRTLFLTAGTSLYRVRTRLAGARTR